MIVSNINVVKPDFDRIYFGRSWLDSNGNQLHRTRFCRLCSVILPSFEKGDLLQVFAQTHFSSQFYTKAHSFVSSQIKICQPYDELVESEYLPGMDLSCYPGENLRPRTLNVAGKPIYDPSDVYRTISRFCSIQVDVQHLRHVRKEKGVSISLWAWARSFGADPNEDFIVIGGEDYFQFSVTLSR